MFLWIIVSAMAVALAAEVFSFVATVLAVAGAMRRLGLVQKEVAGRVRPSIHLIHEVAHSLEPELQRLRRDGVEMATILSSRFRVIRLAWQDAGQRAERLRLRLRRESVATVEQLQRHMPSADVFSRQFAPSGSATAEIRVGLPCKVA